MLFGNMPICRSNYWLSVGGRHVRLRKEAGCWQVEEVLDQDSIQEGLDKEVGFIR